MLWNRLTYTIHTIDYRDNLKAFEIIQDGKVQTVYPGNVEEMQRIINDLDNGKDIEGIDIKK